MAGSRIARPEPVRRQAPEWGGQAHRVLRDRHRDRELRPAPAELRVRRMNEHAEAVDGEGADGQELTKHRCEHGQPVPIELARGLPRSCPHRNVTHYFPFIVERFLYR